MSYSHSLYGTNSPVGRSLNPRYLQTTAVCLSLHWVPHTLPHLPLLHTSSLPSLSDSPPTSLISPVEQPSVSHINLLCCLNWPIFHSTLCSLKHNDPVHLIRTIKPANDWDILTICTVCSWYVVYFSNIDFIVAITQLIFITTAHHIVHCFYNSAD